jgi:uncharacterized membrane protein
MVTFDARAGKWLALALVVSLGANMFMGGLLAGRFAARPPEGPPPEGPSVAGNGPPAAPGPQLAQAIRLMAAALPEADRAGFEQAFFDRRREIMRANVATREARLALRDAIMADPFDRARVEQGFATLRARNEDVQHVLHTIAIDAIARLSTESRQALANWAQPPRPPAQPAQRPAGPRGPAAPNGPGSNRP